MHRKTFGKQVKLAVVHELEAGKTIAQVCREYEITSSMASRWKREYNHNPARAFAGKGHAISLEAHNAELERTVGKLYLQVEFLKKVQQALQQKLEQAKNKR